MSVFELRLWSLPAPTAMTLGQFLALMLMVGGACAMPNLADDTCCSVSEDLRLGSTCGVDLSFRGSSPKSFCSTVRFFLHLCSWFQRWFRAEDHHAELQAYTLGFQIVDRVYTCLDLFGASERVSMAWAQQGYLAASFDIKPNQLDDIVTKTGFYRLLHQAMLPLDGQIGVSKDFF